MKQCLALASDVPSGGIQNAGLDLEAYFFRHSPGQLGDAMCPEAFAQLVNCLSVKQSIYRGNSL